VIWVLLGRRAGDNKQMLALARATGLPFTAIQLEFNGASALPNILLGASRISLASKDKLVAPWPIAVISAGRRAVPTARWIKAMSGGTTRLIHIGRPWGPLSWFDLIVTTPQYGLPDLPHILNNLMPLTEERDEILDPADWIKALPRPLLGVIVGGNSRPLVLDVAAAGRLLDLAFASAQAGSIALATSPRTPPAVVAFLREKLAASPVPSHLVVWQKGAADAYPQILSQADRLIVTGDSAAMVADAALSGHPTAVFPLEERPDLRWRAARLLVKLLGRSDIGMRIVRCLTGAGLLSSVRNIELYQRQMAEAGLLNGGVGAAERGRAELAMSAERVRQLLL
jgi:mitochondrial fission protein ELM1